MTDNNDLALLTTKISDSPSSVHTPDDTAPLTIVPPAIGSAVTALGHAEAAVNYDVIEGRPHVHFEVPTLVTTGRIEEHYHEKRDTVLVNFPAMQSDLIAPGGTSGGPVVNED